MAEAPAFRDAFLTHRCLIVADGFYEWRAEETGKKPVWITRPEREPFAFAGLWAAARRADGSIRSLVRDRHLRARARWSRRSTTACR